MPYTTDSSFVLQLVGDVDIDDMHIARGIDDDIAQAPYRLCVPAAERGQGGYHPYVVLVGGVLERVVSAVVVDHVHDIIRRAILGYRQVVPRPSMVLRVKPSEAGGFSGLPAMTIGTQVASTMANTTTRIMDNQRRE